jgi:hypothetical protein
MEDEEWCVRFCFNEPQRGQVCGEPAILGLGSLLQSVYGLVQAANQLWFGWIGEARGLTAEDCLTEGVVEEGVLHIELLNRPGARWGESEHCADGGRFHNRVESLIVVHPRAPSEAPNNPVSLAVVESPIEEELVCEDPLADDDVGATGPENKFPCPIAH